jgi:hypothetical protein
MFQPEYVPTKSECRTTMTKTQMPGLNLTANDDRFIPIGVAPLRDWARVNQWPFGFRFSSLS